MGLKEDGPFDIVESKIKELVLQNLPCVEVAIVCIKLERLVLT